MFKNINQSIRFAAVLLFGSMLFVVTTNSHFAAAIARGYTTQDTGLQVGMIVALSADSADSTEVERATRENQTKIVGVATTINANVVSSSSEGSTLLVETDGQADAYVSDINGEVKKGDNLIISPLKGILMKAGDTSGVIIGIAADQPDGGTAYNYDENGQSKTTQVAKIKIDLSHKGATNGAAIVPDSTLGKVGRALVGKQVSDVRVLVSLIIFLLVLIAEGAILYGAISSAIISLGRNPLAREGINRELVRVVIIAVFVLIVGVGAVYSVMWV